MLALNVTASVVKQLNDDSTLLPPLIVVALIILLVIKEMLSGLEGNLIRRTRRVLTFMIVPLMIVFTASVITTVLSRILANVSTQ